VCGVGSRWTERKGVWFTDDVVTVEGVWRVDAVAVAVVRAGGSMSQPDADDWTVPCPPPDTGWADGDGMPWAGLAPEEVERSYLPLAEEVDGHPERYHGQWIGYPDGDPMESGAPKTDMGEPIPGHTVMIVGTVDDPVAVQAELAKIYPGNYA